MAQTHAPLGFIEGEISRAEQRLAALEQQRDAALLERQAAIVAASAAEDEISLQERLRNGISASEPASPIRRLGVFIEPMTGIREAMSRQRGGPWLDAALASDAAYKKTQRLNALSGLIGQARLQLAQLEREAEAALLAAGLPPRGWSTPPLPMLSEPAASAA